MIANPIRSETIRSRSGLSWSVAMAKWVPCARTSSYSTWVRCDRRGALPVAALADERAGRLGARLVRLVDPLVDLARPGLVLDLLLAPIAHARSLTTRSRRIFRSTGSGGSDVGRPFPVPGGEDIRDVRLAQEHVGPGPLERVADLASRQFTMNSHHPSCPACCAVVSKHDARHLVHGLELSEIDDERAAGVGDAFQLVARAMETLSRSSSPTSERRSTPLRRSPRTTKRDSGVSIRFCTLDLLGPTACSPRGERCCSRTGSWGSRGGNRELGLPQSEP